MQHARLVLPCNLVLAVLAGACQVVDDPAHAEPDGSSDDGSGTDDPSATGGEESGGETGDGPGPVTGAEDGGGESGGSDSGSGGDDGNTCGNGTIDLGEVCDDGINDGAYGGCMAGCQEMAARCGDGHVDLEEACDAGEANGVYGFCASDCSGIGEHCGDGVTQDLEVCDDGNRTDADGCNVDCRPSGEVRWTYSLATDDGEFSDTTAVAVAADGTSIVVGRRGGATEDLGYLVLLDPDGTFGWDDVLDYADVYTSPNGVAVQEDGSILVVGDGDDGGWRRRYTLGGVATDSELAPGVWWRSVACTSGLGCAVAGWIGYDTTVDVLDEDGAPVWSENSTWRANDVTVWPDGSVGLAGFRTATQGFARRLANGGAQEWAVAPAAAVRYLAIAATPTGGSIELSSDAAGTVLEARDATGATLWQSASTDHDWQDLAVDPGGDIVAVGTIADDDGTLHAVARKFAPNGSTRWTTVVDGLDTDLTNVEIAAATGQIVASGRTREASPYSGVVVSFAP